MSYPERGATYQHNPKFLDRMRAAERADGGPLTMGIVPLPPQMNTPTALRASDFEKKPDAPAPAPTPAPAPVAVAPPDHEGGGGDGGEGGGGGE